MADPQLRQVKDFLGVFNRISETCFNTCVNTFVDRTTTDEEIQCLDRCVTKYLGLNHKLMEVYVEIQPEIIQRRMNELSSLNNQASNEEEVKTNEVPVN
ncbi:mitochondrial import inner membrane translocase subunit Tim10 B [Halyomorpha halys]|uniref:mitochondrial import inner membrane translocase subunit Tim10 B n=1 Tax=Halyomorpha halys TaxID=286706 RepID=UPI0006D4F1F5|nr:mitochondrial import inner membrane translocase subunit Tim10 B [Halyomorpha halys]